MYLIETMRAVGGEIPLWPWHERRLTASLRQLGWPLLQIKEVEAQGDMVRLTIHREGRVEVEFRSLPVHPPVYRVGVSPVLVDASNSWLYHKSSHRGPYDRALEWARAHDLHDALLCNGEGRITESSIASVIAEVNGRWLTPPVSEGLLPGVMRGVLIENGQLWEEPLTPEQLQRADAVYLCNAVRGVFPVEFVSPFLDHAI